MDKKKVYGLVIALGLLYPIISLFSLATSFSDREEVAIVGEHLLNYLASIWVLWVLMVALAIHYKWRTGKNLFFVAIYGFILAGFLIYGYYAQRMVTVFALPTTFDDNHSYGVFASLQHIFSAGILTGLLQAGVWWFTRRWHRK